MSLARRVLEGLREAGVAELVVCPGARNAAFIEAIPTLDFRTVWHFEERSAAFFALGRAQATGRPVAVVTTSGTAAGELLPATMEAYYAGVPLVLVTADRPRRFRGSGAPQAAEQRGIFGVYTPVALDLAGDEPLTIPTFDRPLHLNVCLEDPRGTEAKPSPTPHDSLEGFLAKVRSPLVVVGRLAPAERPAVHDFLLSLESPAYAEALSGLRAAPLLDPLLLRVGDRLFDRAEFDGVLRIGGIPTHRLWRDLEDARADLPVLSLSSLPFSGLGRPSTVLPLDAIGVPRVQEDDRASITRASASPENTGSGRTNPRSAPVAPSVLSDDRRLYTGLVELLEAEPLSEPGLIRRLSTRVETDANVFLGNSLPIREWDLAADPTRPAEFSASRGLNGIDGQLSTFLGGCLPERPNWAVLGDLTTLYDLAGPWPLPQMDPRISATLVTINNSGGRIFERMFPSPDFVNAHGRSFRDWAALWDLPYQRVDDPHEIRTGPGLRVVEMRPDPAATARFWAAYGALLR